MDTQKFDIGIIGGGIVGLATAMALREKFPNSTLAVLEKESELANHQTGNNSGVIHAGIYYKPGSYKAKLCVEGGRLMTQFCEANGVPYERCGKLIVATSEKELPPLQTLYERGTANGIQGLEWSGRSEFAKSSPTQKPFERSTRRIRQSPITDECRMPWRHGSGRPAEAFSAQQG